MPPTKQPSYRGIRANQLNTEAQTNPLLGSRYSKHTGTSILPIINTDSSTTTKTSGRAAAPVAAKPRSAHYSPPHHHPPTTKTEDTIDTNGLMLYDLHNMAHPGAHNGRGFRDPGANGDWR